MSIMEILFTILCFLVFILSFAVFSLHNKVSALNDRVSDLFKFKEMSKEVSSLQENVDKIKTEFNKRTK